MTNALKTIAILWVILSLTPTLAKSETRLLDYATQSLTYSSTYALPSPTHEEATVDAKLPVLSFYSEIPLFKKRPFSLATALDLAVNDINILEEKTDPGYLMKWTLFYNQPLNFSSGNKAKWGMIFGTYNVGSAFQTSDLLAELFYVQAFQPRPNINLGLGLLAGMDFERFIWWGIIELDWQTGPKSEILAGWDWAEFRYLARPHLAWVLGADWSSQWFGLKDERYIIFMGAKAKVGFDYAFANGFEMSLRSFYGPGFNQVMRKSETLYNSDIALEYGLSLSLKRGY